MQQVGGRALALNIRYPASVACLVAGIDKQRFNEAVAAKRYPCAPEVPRGGTRTFNKHEMIPLFIYARLVEQGIPPSVSGEIACAAKQKLDQNPEAEEIRVPRYKEEGQTPPELQDVRPPMKGESYSVSIEMLFDIAGMRGEIDRRLSSVMEKMTSATATNTKK